MEHALCDCRRAISTYQAAKQVAPEDWLPWLGLAQSYIANGQADEGFAVLNEMASQTNRGFDWYYQLGDKCLQLDKPKLAAESIVEAVKCARTTEQKSIAASQLFPALLRDNQIVEAKAMKDLVFANKKPKECQVYVRTAAALLPVTDPASGQALLQAAVADLKGVQDSDAFFRLGKIFENKAGDRACKANQVRAWLDHAGTAYEQAIVLEPREAKYHLAFASILDREGKAPEVLEELAKAQAIDRGDSLAPFLVSCLEKSPNELAMQLSGVNLSNVHFNVNGLTCACKISVLETALKEIRGVAFVGLTHHKPYRGTILVDQSVTPIDAVFHAMAKAATPNIGPQTPPAGLTFDVVSNERVKPSPVQKELRRIKETQKFSRSGARLCRFLPEMPVNIAGTACRHVTSGGGDAPI